MAWLLQKESPQRELAERFRQLVKRGPVVLPGAHDALSALIAQRVGFEALYLSGAAYTASRGLPDLGLVTSQELAERARDIVRATDLPLIVDADTGFGEPMNVARTIQELEDAGLAGTHIEDQINPKRCGHLDGKSVVDESTAIRRIRAAATGSRGRSGPESGWASGKTSSRYSLITVVWVMIVPSWSSTGTWPSGLIAVNHGWCCSNLCRST